MSQNDTICALSTAAGIGAIAMVRISGDKSITLAQSIFNKKIEHRKTHEAIHGWIQFKNEKIDEVLLTIFKAPHSFTGETCVEITCHGSLYIQQRILELLLNNGARMAQPGEFTMRAYLNGKMDLSQAEAVGDLIASESGAAHKQALHQMRGGFSKEINGLRDRLIHFASMVELELDFAEEDVEFANREELRKLLVEILGIVDELKDSFRLGNALKNGVPVAIIGAPNAGKSTLLNTLLNEERAIVSEIAGTTRDTIEDYITLEGIRFIFIDTAGIRQTEDVIEKMGIARAFSKARSASIVLLLFDVHTTSLSSLTLLKKQVLDESGDKTHLILLGNKTDTDGFDENKFADEKNIIFISAKKKTHIDQLKTELLAVIESGRISSGETIVTNARHFDALTKASYSLSEILQGLDTGITGDFLAVDIRKTLYHLGEITGEINADDLLNNIFSTFCIGK